MNETLVNIEGTHYGYIQTGETAAILIHNIANTLNLQESSLYALQNGRICETIADGAAVNVCFRVLGGKGGFGSMLRAIGAQIEKTTNREACRDLSGRRLRDIREEQRLRNWAAGQPQREEEARRRKEEKLKKLCVETKHTFNDAEYEATRKNLEEAGEAAIEAGTKAVRLAPDQKTKAIKRKRPKLWIDDEISGSSSSESGCEDDKSDDNREASMSTASPAPSFVTGKGKGIGKKSRTESPTPQSNSIEPDSGNESEGRTVMI